MLKSEINIGSYYITTISNKPAAVRIDSENRHGGWNATNMNTGRAVRIKSGRKLQREVTRQDVERFQSTKARREVRNGDHGNGHGNGNGKCEVCGVPVSRPHHTLCYTHWREQNQIGGFARTGERPGHAPGERVLQSGGYITLMGKNVDTDDMVNRITDRVSPLVSSLRNDATALGERGYGQFATKLANLAYAIENDMLDSIEDLM